MTQYLPCDSSVPESKRRPVQNDLEIKVHQALDRMVENGYLPSPTSKTQAIDLVTYDSDFDSYNPKDLVNYIESWNVKLPLWWYLTPCPPGWSKSNILEWGTKFHQRLESIARFKNSLTHVFIDENVDYGQQEHPEDFNL